MHLEVNGTRLWFDVDGPALVPDGAAMRERPTVVLLHGGPGSFDHSYFKPDFARLAEAAQVVYLDLRGTRPLRLGRPGEWSFEVCADDVRAFCDALGIAKPVVYGHSLGGFVAMLYAARHPGHAGALVPPVHDGPLRPHRLVEGFRRVGGDEVAAIAERACTAAIGASVTPRNGPVLGVFGPWVPGEQEQARSRQPGWTRRSGADARLRRPRPARPIDCPTLVCVGELDPVTPVAAAREIVDALPAAVRAARGASREQATSRGRTFPTATGRSSSSSC